MKQANPFHLLKFLEEIILELSFSPSYFEKKRKLKKLESYFRAQYEIKTFTCFKLGILIDEGLEKGKSTINHSFKSRFEQIKYFMVLVLSRVMSSSSSEMLYLTQNRCLSAEEEYYLNNIYELHSLRR